MTFQRKTLTLIATLLASHLCAEVKKDPAQLFQIHCAACHQPQFTTVGPSMVEIRKLYNGKPEAFIDWCYNPKRKRTGAVEMPAMTHVPKEDLMLIYNYIISESDGLRQRGKKILSDLYPARLKKRPRVQRIFIKNSGPASIAVALKDTYSFVWDAGACRLRYVWQGDFIEGFKHFNGNGKARARPLNAKIVFTESQSPIEKNSKGKNVKFLGYKLVNEIPTFRYKIDAMLIEERIESRGADIIRSFIFQNASPEISLTFQKSANLSYFSNVGSWEDNVLTAKTSSPIIVTIKTGKK